MQRAYSHCHCVDGCRALPCLTRAAATRAGTLTPLSAAAARARLCTFASASGIYAPHCRVSFSVCCPHVGILGFVSFQLVIRYTTGRNLFLLPTVCADCTAPFHCAIVFYFSFPPCVCSLSIVRAIMFLCSLCACVLFSPCPCACVIFSPYPCA